MVLAAVFILTLPLYAETFSGQAEFKPWSGYWWPLKQGELVHGYNGHPSPIEKYDLYVHGYYPAAATQMAKAAWYDPDVPYWYGICNGWANAAILEHQEFKPSADRNLFLNVGDKKGLLAAIHAEDETLHESCYSPEPFHRYLLKYIGEQGQAIAADLDISEEFWSYPIFSYDMEISRGTNADLVRCRIKFANDQDFPPDYSFPPDYEGTVEVEKTYSYKLDKDTAGNYIKGGGSWQGASITDHPDIVWVPIARRPERLFIDYDTVKEMALSRGDNYQDEGRLKPGHHLLLVEPNQPRVMYLSLKKGNRVNLQVALDRQYVRGNLSRIILERDGDILVDRELDRNLFKIDLVGSESPGLYRLTLKPEKDNQTGCAVHLYVDYSATYQHWFYGYPVSSYWLGNAASIENPGEITVEVVGDKGLPFGEGKLASATAAEQLLTVVPTAAETDYYSGNRPLAVKVSSLEPLCGLTFAGDDSAFFGSTASSAGQAQQLVIPWLTSRYNMRVRSELYLAQLDGQDNQVSINYYKDDGTFYRQQDLTLTGEEVVYYEKGRYPYNININGWALANAERPGLDGAVIRSAGNYLKDQLPLLSLAQEWLLPHPAVGSGWQTTLSLYNPTGKDMSVSIRCHGDEIPEPLEYLVSLAPFAHETLDINGSLWGISEEDVNNSWLSLQAEGEFAGFMSYQFGSDSSASIPLQSMHSEASRNLPQIASNSYWWTGMVFVNRAVTDQVIELTAYDIDGNKLEKVELKLTPQQKYCDNVTALFSPETIAQGVGSLHLEQAGQVSAMAIFGTMYGATRISAFYW